MEKLTRYERRFDDRLKYTLLDLKESFKYKIGFKWNSTEGLHEIEDINFTTQEVIVHNHDRKTWSYIPFNEFEREVKLDIEWYNSRKQYKKDLEDKIRAEDEYKQEIRNIVGKISPAKLGNIIKHINKPIKGKTYKDLIENVLNAGGKISDTGILVPVENIHKDIAIGYKLNKYQTEYAIKYGDFSKLKNYVWGG